MMVDYVKKMFNKEEATPGIMDAGYESNSPTFETFILEWLYSSSAVFFLVPAIVFPLLVMVLVMFFRPQPETQDRKLDFNVLYHQKVRSLFPEQSEELHATICTGAHSVLREAPERPSVFALLASSSASGTAVQLAQRAALSIAGALSGRGGDPDAFTIDAGHFTHRDDYWTVHGVLASLMADYQVAVVTDFQRMHPYAATAVSALADDTYSAYPQACIFLTVDTGSTLTGTQLINMPAVNAAEKFLKEIWEEVLDRKVLTDLLGCTTGRAVVVVDEKLEGK